MPTVFQLIRRHLLEGLCEMKLSPRDIIERETSLEFTRLKNNRKIIGSMRYGPMGSKDKPDYDRVSCMIRRLERYKVDKNAEHLVDVANLAELEYVEGNHRGVIAIDDGDHTPEI